MAKCAVMEQAAQVAELEAIAIAAQHERDDAADRYDVAVYYHRQPNRFSWQHQANALLVAGLLSLGGIGIALGQGNPTWGVVGTGAAVTVGMVSKAMDDDRQTLEKQDQLLLARQRLEQAEQALQTAVKAYQEAEERRWLMLALDLSPAEFHEFQAWMADPRRSMKDAILESVDLVSKQLVLTGLELGPNPTLDYERRHRALRQRLFSPDFQLAKDEFLATIANKHRFQQQQSQIASEQAAKVQAAVASTSGAAVVGMAAGATVASLINNAAGALDSSKDLVNTIATLGGAATVVGVGMLTAGAIVNLMLQSEHDRQQREEQEFQAAFTITRAIHQSIVQLWALPDNPTRNEQVTQVLATIRAFQQRELKGQDLELKTFVDMLYAYLKRYLEMCG
ncbi:MAG: hypothetical protein NZ772_01330 [Cyanobacteria bacterium]|nr:hypothetical protein [Cyanobacteriota bacterium]MDW8200056.1 hypothetical protein [Cyanobacteriota bacterium SKYGB_h_bin112]